MPYLDDLQRSVNFQPLGQGIVKKGEAVSSFYPTWEQTTPQWQSPNPYAMAQAGIRTNEFVHSIIMKRALAVGNCSLMVRNTAGETTEEMPNHNILSLLKNANQFLPESYFWGISEISRCVAGFSAWEVETNNLGEPIKLWWMRPDWCSFIRGEQKPLAYIRYQPWGLTPADVPIENILFMYQPENFDPLFPFVKFISPTMLALPQIHVDTGMTQFLDNFISRGARFGGLISVAQTLTEDSAKEIQKRWAANHGGTENWSVPLVLGQGADYKPMQMDFDDMAFPQLDARTEVRICAAFGMDPIVASARAGLDVSSYNNKKQAVVEWHYEWVLPTLRAYAGAFGSQMLPRYEDKPEDFECEFNTEDLYALQEDKVIARQFWLSAFTAKAVTKNEFRERLQLDPVENGDEFEADAPPTPPMGAGTVAVDEKGKPLPKEEAQDESNGKAVTDDAAKEDTPIVSNTAMDQVQEGSEISKPDKEKKSAELQNEIAAFRKFAHKRIKEFKYNDIFEFEFKHVPDADRLQLIKDVQAGAVLHALRDAIKGGAGSGNFGHEGRPGEVGGSAENGETDIVEE